MAAYALNRSPIFDGDRHYGSGIATATMSHRRYWPTSQDELDTFFLNLREWEAATSVMSSPEDMFSHKSFQRIVDLGEFSVPYVLKEIAYRPSFLFFALNKITGEVPYTREMRGNVKAMCEAWVAWGNQKGYALS